MVMAPIDLRGREFHKAFRGYAEDEVDTFLELVINDYETLYREHLNLKDQLAHQEDNMGHYRNLEDTLKSTLVVAQKTAEDVRATAEKEASTHLETARKQAEMLLREAEAKAVDIIRGAQERSQSIVREYAEIQRQAQLFKLNLRTMLQTQLELLNQNYPTTEAVYEQGTALEMWIAKEQIAPTKEVIKAEETNKVQEPKTTPPKQDMLMEPRYNPNQQEEQ